MKLLVVLFTLLVSTYSFSASVDKIEQVVKPLLSSEYAQKNIKFYLEKTNLMKRILKCSKSAKYKRVSVERILEQTKIHGIENKFVGYITNNHIEKISKLIKQYRFGEARENLDSLSVLMHRYALK